MAAVMLFLRQTTGKTERHTHFCIPLEPVFTRDCGGRVHFTDEPTGNLDSRTTQEVLGLLKLTGEQFHQTIVMITHNEALAQLCDRVIHIEDGRIVEDHSGKDRTNRSDQPAERNASGKAASMMNTKKPTSAGRDGEVRL